MQMSEPSHLETTCCICATADTQGEGKGPSDIRMRTYTYTYTHTYAYTVVDRKLNEISQISLKQHPGAFVLEYVAIPWCKQAELA